MNIVIRTIDHKDQRYETVGDWQFIGPNLLITVSDLGNNKMNALIAIHELIEALLCKFNDPEITTEMVDSFDMSKQVCPDCGGNGLISWGHLVSPGPCQLCGGTGHLDLDEPGSDPTAPYYIQHLQATIIEELLSIWLKIDWKEYEKRIQEL